MKISQNPHNSISLPYGAKIDPLQSSSNLTYLEFIDIIERLWTRGHPDIKFGPYGNHSIFDPELGYIIYSLESKEPKANSPRLRLFEIKEDLDTGKKYAVYTQSFNILVSFSAVHKNPRVADEILEEFETFMLKTTQALKFLGVESLTYARRLSDSQERRVGEDVSSRATLYLLSIQNIIIEELDLLEEVILFVQAIFAATPSYGSLISGSAS